MTVPEQVPEVVSGGKPAPMKPKPIVKFPVTVTGDGDHSGVRPVTQPTTL